MCLDCMKSYPNYIPMINPPKKLVISPWYPALSQPTSSWVRALRSKPQANCSSRSRCRCNALATSSGMPSSWKCWENAGETLRIFGENVPDISWNVQKSPIMLWSKHGNCRNHQGNCWKMLKDVETAKSTADPLLLSVQAGPCHFMRQARWQLLQESFSRRTQFSHWGPWGPHGAPMGPSPSMSRKRLICWT